ncbi:MAG TPA: 2OG-Fe(II) oxygenase [Steroidobacteraceae bacterium]|nr:2OG-Fe(II) oxygenase [Steroidobacteraceae bacterium]
MAVTVNLPSELRGWIINNLDRGCAPAELVKSMIGQRFEPQIAHGLVSAFVKARSTGVEPPTSSVSLDLTDQTYHNEAPRIARGNLLRTTDREIPVLLRYEKPIIVVLERVFSDEECAQLIELARPRLRLSTVVDPQTGANTVANYRNSEGMFFRLGETPLIERLDQRVSEIMNCPVVHGEGLQVLRYGVGGHTAPHFDFLIPSNPTNEASVKRSGQRHSTLIIYLSDVAQGGETVFPEVGLSVSPRRGNALYFEYANSRQQLDARSLHAGAPVIEGEKWAVTKWMRTRPFVAA